MTPLKGHPLIHFSNQLKVALLFQCSFDCTYQAGVIKLNA